MNDSTKRRQAVYKKRWKSDDLWQACEVCGLKSTKHTLDRHHPGGRQSLGSIVLYFYVCRGCHDRIHANPAWAEKQGYLHRNRNIMSNTDDYQEMVASICKPGTEIYASAMRDERLSRLLVLTAEMSGLVGRIYSRVAGRGMTSEEAAHPIHCALGLMGEVGEITDAVKKSIIYGQELDVDNIEEEIGDLNWYMTALVTIGAKPWEWKVEAMDLDALMEGVCGVCGTTLSKAKARNKAKLVGDGGRYEHGYSDEAAKARVDKAGESNQD